ncbi:hypothetical protein [Bacillus andreraoultii]|uniref:hypothetical protein n=1 Tax=Bacillus andreraoultii TaxID=1499685 RepID=UPI00053AB297|nr:hypothetical protein [Bacillus andreraoultii]
MEKVYEWLIVFGIIGLQYFLSRRQKAFWGAILPIAYIVLMITLLVAKGFHEWGSVVFYSILGLLVLFGIWGQEREELNKKRQKELEKIQAQDL